MARLRKKSSFSGNFKVRLRIVPLSISPSSETRKKPTRKKMPARDLARASRFQDLAWPFRLLADFLRFSLDGLSDRETTRTLLQNIFNSANKSAEIILFDCLSAHELILADWEEISTLNFLFQTWPSLFLEWISTENTFNDLKKHRKRFYRR